MLSYSAPATTPHIQRSSLEDRQTCLRRLAKPGVEENTKRAVRIVREACQIEKVHRVILKGAIPPAAAGGAEQLQACACLYFTNETIQYVFFLSVTGGL